MLIGHIGMLISLITFITSLLAFMYAHDAYEVDSFERNCFKTIGVCLFIDIAALVLKDYSVLYFFDYLQFVVDAGILALFIRLYWCLFKRKS